MTDLTSTPAGGHSMAEAPTVEPMSFSQPTSSLAFTGTISTLGWNFAHVAWWRYECQPEADWTTVWFDALQSKNQAGGDPNAGLVLLDQDGNILSYSTGWTDPVDGFVYAGAVLSPTMRAGDVVYIAVGTWADDPPEVLYRLRVSAPSELTGWVQMPDRDGDNAVIFDPEAAPYVVDPELPYLPPPSYNAGFVGSPTWSGFAQVHDHKLSRTSNPPDGGPYANIFTSGAALSCVTSHAMTDGKWNTEGLTYGMYWHDYCPPPTGPWVRGAGNTSDYLVRIQWTMDRTDSVITDDDSITASYKAPSVAFNLHEAQKTLGPSGGWLLQQQAMTELIAEIGVLPDLVWENDRCEILNVSADRHYGDTASPTGALIDADWRGGASRLLTPDVLNPWGPYLEVGGTDDTGMVVGYRIVQYGSSAGPGSMSSIGAVAFDTFFENSKVSVPDWQAGYDLEESLAYELDGVVYYTAPGLTFVAAANGFDALGDSSVADHATLDQVATITDAKLSYTMGVRPARYRFRIPPSIPAVVTVAVPQYLTPLIDADLLDTGQRFFGTHE